MKLRLLRRSSWIAALLILCLLAVVADRVYAQNATVKGKGKLDTILVTQLNVMANNANFGEAVPDKMTYVLTDILVTNGTASNASFQIQQLAGASPGFKTNLIEVAGHTTFAYNFGTGIEFPPADPKAGTTASKPGIFANGQDLKVTFIGYLRKGS